VTEHFSPEAWGAILTALFTGALALFTALMAWFAYRAYCIQKLDALHRNRETASRARTYSALFLNPAKYVGAYAVKTQNYLSISKDAELAAAIEENADLLILGRSGIGKSHAAVKHIKQFARRHWYQQWQVLIPDRLDLSRMRAAPIRRKNYIIFFDDLNEYINSSDNYTVFDAIDAVRDAAKRIRVIATLRSTSPSIDSIGNETKYYTRFRTIELEDWTEAQRDSLIAQTGVAPSYWDGTPLSGKQPSDAQRRIYLGLPENEKYILSCAKIGDFYGLHYCDKNLLFELVTQSRPKISEEYFKSGIGTINRTGFLKRNDNAIQLYTPYLAFVADEGEQIFTTLKKILLQPDVQFNKELFVVGRSSYQRQEFESARKLLEEYTKREPAEESGHYRLASTYLRLNDVKAAIPHLIRAITLQPKFLSALYRLSNAYERIGEQERARAAFLSARAAQKENHPAHLLALAELSRLSDEPDEALELVTQCLHEDPTIRHGWGVKGQILLRLNRYDLAEAAFKEAASREPDAFVYFGLGQTARIRREWSAAAAAFQSAIEISPNFSAAYPLLGQALLKLGRKDEASDAFQSAIRLDPEYAGGYFGLGLSLMRKREWQEAKSQFEIATTKDPNFAEAYSWLGTALEHLSEFDKALVAHKHAIQIFPSSKHFQFGYAQTLAKAGNPSEAAANYQICLDIDPTFKIAAERMNALRSRLASAPTTT
jgi:tetratricopeptide (TPR) repeat protein